ncbi:PKD domain-containing protein [Aureispira sp. CCB-E]|uniref:PKD domain-containing protein n=1 Tax=Aureispira sp. CCB-E TaxID=3051121 RepID=UPI002868A8ED|nr:PKD domain-containing protein [Aureispira sp. CCB-E]WMX15763.1 PKD domain-containing protein [Aureispira sp. CCB-E]
MKTATWFYLVFFLFCSCLIQAQPIVNLGPDTTVCGNSLMLDAGNTGATFLWNTGATTQNLMATASGTYWVDVTDVSGTTRDSIEVILVAPPNFITQPNDTTLCGGLINLAASADAGSISWIGSLGSIISLGDNLIYELLDTTTLYYQAVYIDTVGRTFAQGGSSYPSVSRAIIFNVNESIRLNSVMIDINNGPFTADIELEDNTGTVISSKSISYNTAGRYEVFLGFDIPIGTNYRLYMRNISGGGVHSLFPYNNWASDHNYGFIELTNSTDPTVYPIFWEWKVTKLDGCNSLVDSVILNMLPTPIVNLGEDTTLCGGNITIDATNIGTGFTYLWNTGNMTSSLTTDSTGVYAVTISSGGSCLVSDSIGIVINTKPIVQSIADTSICKGVRTIATTTNVGLVTWTDLLGRIVGIGDTLSYEVMDTTTLYYQAVYIDTIGRTFAQGGSSYPSVSRAIIFNVNELIRLNSVMIDINNGPFTADIELEDNTGTVISSKSISYNTAGRYEVFLGFDIPIGTNYRLYMRNISGGGVYSLFPYNNWASDHNYGFIELTNSTDPTVYPIFWEWKVTKLDGCNSNIDTFTLNALPTPVVNLGSDTTLCEDTLTLDATNVGGGYTYQWNTSAITPNIQASTTGIYKVTVSVGGNCSVEDSISLLVNSQPTILQGPTNMMSLCRKIYSLVANSNVGEIRWIDKLGNTIALEDTLTYELLDTTTLYYQAVYVDTIGRTFAQGGSSYPSVSRAIIFNVNESIRLNSVMIDINNGPFTADIELEDNTGTVISSKSISYNTAGRYEVFLDFDIPIGTNYRLYMRNISGGGVYSLFPYNNWASDHNYGFIELTNSTDPTVYPIFWEWKITKLDGCNSLVDSVVLNMLPTPTIELGPDTILCGGGITLDATNAGAGYQYIWNTADTTPTIQAITSNLYQVTVSFGGSCSIVDSLNVVINERPTFLQSPNDTTLCGGLYTLNTTTNVGVTKWTAVTGETLGYGNTLSYNLQDTTTLFYQASYFDTIGRTFTQGGSSYPTVSGRGIIFDVLEPIDLNSVHINIDNGPFSATIELEDATGTLIAAKNISYLSAGVYEVFLDFNIPVGVDYTLYLRNVSGGGVLTLFPYSDWANDHDYGFVKLKNATDPTVYPAFWEWKVTLMNEVCASEVDSVLLNMLPTPLINLQEDTVVCNDSIVLDVFFPNATYNWSLGGINTSSILVTQEGIYSVTSTIGTCSNKDTINVFLAPEPTVNLISSDTSTCVGEIPRLATGADFVKWYTEPVGGNYLGNGSLFMYDAQVSDTIWCTGQNFANKVYTEGLVDTFVSNQTAYFFPNQIRGLVFDVQEDLLLKEVTMYINQTSFIGTIELWDANNVVLYTQPIVLTDLGKNIISLGFTIPVGVDYKLMLTDYNTIPILSEFPYTGFPINGDFLTIKSGIPFSSVYQYFYNWNVQGLSCPTDRIPSVVEVLPTPNIDFPTDSIICGDTLVLDASSLGLQSYQWSTGETTSSIILDSTTTITLEGSIGICTDEDSMNVFIVEPPSLIIPPNDTTVCQGNMTFYATGNAAYYAWYNSETSATPFALGDSVVVNLQDTTTLWVEGIGFIPKSEPLGEQYNPNSNLNVWGTPQLSVYPTRGMTFTVNSPILLNSVAIYVDTVTTATLTIYKTGFPYYTQQLSLTNAGENVVQIDTLLENGSYSIELSNKSAGRILFLSPYTNLAQLNANASEITFTGSVPLASQYVYFFNWKISTPSCATNRLPINITVPPSPSITLTADTATCTLGSITLDPIQNNNPAYTYAWSGGSSSDTLAVNSSGYYRVTVTNDGVCSSVKDIYVQFLSTPNASVVSDLDICAPQDIALSVPTSDGIVVWYDSSDLNTVSYLTAPYNVYVGDTTDFWIDVAPKATTRIGKQAYDNPNESSAYLNFIIANRFDVHEYAVLDSVAIYVETAPAVANVVLMDSSGNTINTVSYTVTKAKEKVFLPLNFLIPPGENYQLSFSSINSLFLVDRSPITAPSSSANIATLTGTIFSDYSYFFDWHFSYAYPDCHSVGDTFTVNVSMPVDIPDSIYTCDSVTIDASHPNIVSYNWSNGLTSGVTTFNNAGTYTLTITDGALCTVIDTVIITQPMPVGLPLGNAACDFQLSTNYSLNNASFSWNTGDTTDVITIPSTGIYAVTVTTGEGCMLVDTAYISQIISPPAPNLGNFVSACYTDTLDAGYGGQGMTYLWNTGEISQTIIVNTAGIYAVTVTHPLGCAGTDFVSVTIDTAPKAAFSVTKSGRTVLMNNMSTGTNQAVDYFWEMGDGTTYQIPNPFHTYTDSGCYIIRLTVTDACGSDTDTLRVPVDVPDSVCTVAINTIASSLNGIDLDIIPNPNSGTFLLQLSEPLQEKTEVQLYDLNGRIVHTQELPLSTQTNWKIQVEDLPTGVYFLRLLNPKQSQTHRVLILRE